MQNDEHLPLHVYFKNLVRTPDGIAWIVTCIGAAVALADLLIGTNFVPLRDGASKSKAVVLLMFSPLLVFLFLIVLRQLPFARYAIAAWIRAAICIACFLAINF